MTKGSVNKSSEVATVPGETISADELRNMTLGELLEYGTRMGFNMSNCDSVGKALTRLLNNATQIRSVYD